MIHFILSSILLLANPDSTVPGVPPMAPEIAHTQILRGIQEDIQLVERIAILEDVIDRCEDIDLVSIATINLGNLYFLNYPDQSEQLILAVKAYKNADRKTALPSIRARARYNLGHALYKQADAQSKLDSAQPAKSFDDLIKSMNQQINQLLAAAGAFRSVVDVDADHQNAFKNLERVRREIQELREQVDTLEKLKKQQEQQQQEQQQRQQDAADKLEELAQEQQQQGDATENNPPQSESEKKEQREKQEELCNETESTQDSISENMEQSEDIENKIQEAREAQRRAQEAMEKGDQKTAAREQKQAAESLSEAAKMLQEMIDQDQQENSDGNGEEGKESDQSQKGEGKTQPEEESSEEEINQIAKQLLEKERREREARQIYREKGRPVKVEKDW